MVVGGKGACVTEDMLLSPRRGEILGQCLGVGCSTNSSGNLHCHGTSQPKNHISVYFITGASQCRRQLPGLL